VLRRLELEDASPVRASSVEAQRSEIVVPAVAEAELETALLPHDHPWWVKDAVAVSQRARELIARLKPVVVRVLTFWDHRIRSIFVAGSRVEIDASGCYRVP
jgi:hypothetical protein